jgi:hypothetical protein
MMDKTIKIMRTPISLDLNQLSKKPNRLMFKRTMKMGFPSQTKSLKPNQFGLNWKQQHKKYNNKQKKYSKSINQQHQQRRRRGHKGALVGEIARGADRVKKRRS